MKTIIAAITLWLTLSSFAYAQFDIKFTITNGTAATQAAIQPLLIEAKNFWESVVVGYQDGVNLTGADIDVDLELLAGGTTVFGGHGLLGNATSQGGFTFNANDDGTRNRGFIALNPVLSSDERMQNAINHEMGHAIGIGRLWIENGVYSLDSGQYTGTNSLAAYQQEFDASATFVPIELDTFAGPNVHLDENNEIVDAYGRRLSNDLNTGFIDENPNDTFLSRTTAASLVDIGFRIRPMCDFDGDGVCDVSDINAMLETGPIAGGVAAALGVSDQFDLTGDAIIDRSDLVEWLAIAADEAGLSSPYKPGDANLDGVVDVSDFNRWNSNRFTSTLLWSDGNFNADSAVDVQDFNVWNENKFTSSDLAAVPEPSSILLILSPLLILTNLRRSVRCAAK